MQTTEGTGLSFDLTPDGRSIVFDLLGQLWSVPAEGGQAVPLTNAVRDIAEDSDPAVSPDGRWIVFRSDRPTGRGLWLRSLTDGTLRQLTDSSYFPNNEHLSPSWSPDGRRIAYTSRFQLHTREIATKRDTVLRPEKAPGFIHSASWSSDGKRLLLVASNGWPGRLWEVDLATNTATPLDTVTRNVQAPRYSPDGTRIAYFAERDSNGVLHLWVRARGDSAARMIPESREWTSFRTEARVRWSPDGRWLYYSAGGKLWRVGADSGAPQRIPFTASLTVPRIPYPSPVVRLPTPGESLRARGFGGLALAPDARRYAVLALGKLWLADVGSRPRAVAAVPTTATGLDWSRDGTQLVWAAGRGGAQDLFVTDVRTAATRQLTALPGSESRAAWSPDGRWIAFAHWARPASASPPWRGDPVGWRVRVVAANRATVASLADTKDIGSYESLNSSGSPWDGGDLPLNWNDSSTAVLAFRFPGWVAATGDPMLAVWLGLDGEKRSLPSVPFRPSYTHLGRGDSLTYVQNAQLWRTGISGGTPRLLSRAPALYPSVARDGTVLFVSAGGLRFLRPDGVERELGWPVRFRAAAAPAPLLIRNARVFDGTGHPTTAPRDLLIQRGRIQRIAAAGQLPVQPRVTVLDAGGRTLIPGLMDAHAHLVDPAVLPGALYFGVTTIRDMGSELSVAAVERDAVVAGITEGARVLVSGMMVDPSPVIGGWTSGAEWMPTDSASMVRGLELLRAFDAAHVKLRMPLSFASGAMLARLSRARGLSVSGHCGNPLALVVGGIGSQQHLDGQCTRNAPVAYDDRAQLYRSGGVAGVPTIFVHDAYVLASQDTGSTHEPDVEPFLTPLLRLTRLRNVPSPTRPPNENPAHRGARWFRDMGLTLALGVDAPEFPDGVHSELAALVDAGLTPAEALVAATSGAARVLGIDRDVGRVVEGQIADLVLLDGDPTADIHNTRRIWRVIQGGRVIDRDGLRQTAARGLAP